MRSGIKVSNRSDVPMFRALDMMRQVHELEVSGVDVRKMGAGQPSVGAPQEALNYAIEMIKNDPRQGYTEAIGMLSLRERIADYYYTNYGVKTSAAQICVTAGSSSGLILAFLAAFDAGDTIALITPTYPAYRNILKSLNLNVVEIEARAQDGYQPTLELLENYGGNFDGIIINSPSNPAGTIIDETELKKIALWCENKNIRLISDEAYHGITYGQKAQTALAYSHSAIVLNTFSKYFAMTGWRLGWMVIPDELTDRVKKLAENLFVSPPTISQHLAWKIFDHTDVLDSYVDQYARNRDLLLAELPKIGISNFTNAAGAFYVYADVHHLTNSSEEYCKDVLANARVSITAGTDFDLKRGYGTIRICYADSQENIIEACKRLQNIKF